MEAADFLCSSFVPFWLLEIPYICSARLSVKASHRSAGQRCTGQQKNDIAAGFSEPSFQVLAEDPERFKSLVKSSIVRQVTAINKLSDAGM